MATGPHTTDVLLGLLGPVAVYAFYVVVRFVARKWREFRVSSQFPSPPYHWLYGNVHLTEGYIGDKFLSVIRETVKKYPRGYTFWLTGWDYEIYVTHPETIKQLMKTPTSKSECYDYTQLRPWAGNGLFVSDGEMWKVRRRLLTPAFHFGVLKQYMSVYNTEASRIIERLSSYAHTGESFEMFQQASMTTMEIILQCAFSGGRMSKKAKIDYVAAVRKLADLYTKRLFNSLYMMSDFIYNLSSEGREFSRLCEFVHGIAENIIKQRRQQMDSTEGKEYNNKRPDFIDILLRARDEDGRGLSDLEIREEVGTFLFAGHDTTTSALSWTLYSLAQHPEHQEKIREEMQQVLSDRSADTIEWEDLPKLPYLTQCLKEAMRLHSPVPFIARTIKEDATIDGIHLPRDTRLLVAIYAVHHNPDVWGPDHMEFDPARFAPDRIKGKDSYTFIPFSVGQRNCIGQNFAMNEEKVLLARLLHKFQFEQDPSRPVQKEVILTMATRGGMWLQIRPVHHQRKSPD